LHKFDFFNHPPPEFSSSPTPPCVCIAREITFLFLFFVTHAIDLKNRNILKYSLAACFSSWIVWCSTSQEIARLCDSFQFTSVLVAKIVVSPVGRGFEPEYKMSKKQYKLRALWGTVTVWSVSRSLYPIQKRNAHPFWIETYFASRQFMTFIRVHTSVSRATQRSSALRLVSCFL
jgi:hypothetical protein